MKRKLLIALLGLIWIGFLFIAGLYLYSWLWKRYFILPPFLPYHLIAQGKPLKREDIAAVLGNKPWKLRSMEFEGKNVTLPEGNKEILVLRYRKTHSPLDYTDLLRSQELRKTINEGEKIKSILSTDDKYGEIYFDYINGHIPLEEMSVNGYVKNRRFGHWVNLEIINCETYRQAFVKLRPCTRHLSGFVQDLLEDQTLQFRYDYKEDSLEIVGPNFILTFQQ